MRVLAGELKGRRLVTPRGRTTRPTADHVRIACLDTLMPFVGRGPFLDLFAGSGAVGIEALSRGAPSAVLVEDDPMALRALRDNVEALSLAERARVMRGDAARAVAPHAGPGARFAGVLHDPPYDTLPAALYRCRFPPRCVTTPAVSRFVDGELRLLSPPPNTPRIITPYRAGFAPNRGRGSGCMRPPRVRA